MIFKKTILILSIIFLYKCDLPTENIDYVQSPVVFGYIDAGFNKVDTFYLYWSSTLSNSHFENNYIDNATMTLSSGPQSIELMPIGNGKYLPENIYPSPPIEPNSTWYLDINFNYNNTDYVLQSSTTVPNTINPDIMVSDIEWQCDGQEVIFDENDFNLYQSQNNVDLIQSWLNNPNNISFLENDINIDNITYNTADCYTSSFASTPFFTLDIDSENQNDTIISRYLTLALETDKDMNGDGFNIPYEAAIFDTLFDANAFKGPMQYTEINYSDYSGIDLDNIPYEWGWHREPVNRINLEGDQIEFSWLFFNYYGKHITIIQPMGKDYELYFEGDPDQFNLPYILRQGNIENISGEDAYGLFYSTNSKFFLFNVLEPIALD